MTDQQDTLPESDSGEGEQTGSDPDEHVKRTDEGASVQAKITRGTGTRDQEEWRIKGKGENAPQAIAEFLQQYREVFGDIPEDLTLAEHARQFDPSEPDEGDQDG